jgi:hypothetical protein
MTLRIFIIGYVVIFPFTSNPAALNIDKELKFSGEQVLTQKVAKYARSKSDPGDRYFYDHPYLSLALDLDHFDNRVHIDLNEANLIQLQTGDIVIWDNWFAPVEFQISKEQLDTVEGLYMIREFRAADHGKEITFLLYQFR